MSRMDISPTMPDIRLGTGTTGRGICVFVAGNLKFHGFPAFCLTRRRSRSGFVGKLVAAWVDQCSVTKRTYLETHVHRRPVGQETSSGWQPTASGDGTSALRWSLPSPSTRMLSTICPTWSTPLPRSKHPRFPTTGPGDISGTMTATHREQLRQVGGKSWSIAQGRRCHLISQGSPDRRESWQVASEPRNNLDVLIKVAGDGFHKPDV